MSKQLFILANDTVRQRVKMFIDQAPEYYRVEIAEPKRSLDQNDKLHAMLTELAAQVKWHGQYLSIADWKLLFLDALISELRIIPNMNGNGFVNLGRSTSKLSKAEFSDLMQLIEAFGASHGVKFNDVRKVA